MLLFSPRIPFRLKSSGARSPIYGETPKQHACPVYYFWYSFCFTKEIFWLNMCDFEKVYSHLFRDCFPRKLLVRLQQSTAPSKILIWRICGVPGRSRFFLFQKNSSIKIWSLKNFWLRVFPNLLFSKATYWIENVHGFCENKPFGNVVVQQGCVVSHSSLETF